MRRTVSRLILLTSALLLTFSAMAQQQENHATNNNPLAVLLQSKGILSPSEVAMINQASSPQDANARLAQLLVEKGLISSQEYTATVTPPVASGVTPAVTAASLESSKARLSDAVLHTSPVVAAAPARPATPTDSQEPPIIPAVAPLRVLPIDLPKQGGMIPDIRLGSGANMKIYGFFKQSAISEIASTGGPTFGSQDWPLPLLLGDTGPTSDPQFHIKARSFRIGSQFEWVPKNSNLVLTGRVEADYEGDFTNANSVNISSVRNGQFRT